MTIEPGQQLLHYRLLEKIGEGGMGVVWKAIDTKLDREAAIKVLPDLLASDSERLARFEREARLLASLNHPNVAAIYGIHEAPSTTPGQAGVHFLAMELVEGEDLAERLQRGPLSIEAALETAQRIADGLTAAHDEGVVHRDLKPANVKRGSDGTVKVLDFGLAKAVESGSSESSASVAMSPTMTSAGSVAGMIMGTAGYMSPEQARGKPVDARTDVWAFGCLLYEMLTGRRLFEGETVSDILAAVLKTEPDWSRLPSETPPAARRLLKRCLERDPQKRLHHMADARLEIEEALAEPAPADAGAEAAPTRAASGKERLAWIAALLVLAAAMVAVALWPSGSVDRPLVQSMLMPPAGWDFSPASPFAVSRDGRRVAFEVYSRSDNEEEAVGTTAIWIRDLASAESRRLVDTDGDSFPFWSPDGRWIGFFGDGKLNKIEARGGPVIPICDATDGRGGTWNEAGTIVFQRRWSEGLLKVPAGGGTPEPATTLDKDRFDVAHRWPHFLPDGRHFLFYLVSTTSPATSEHGGIYVASLDSDETRLVVRSESRARYARGHLLYRAGTTLMAHPFDASTLTVTGDPFPVSTDVPGGSISWGGAQFGASAADVLVHMRGTQSGLSLLTWRGRDGGELDVLGEPDGFWEPALSHDGTRLAVGVGLDAADIWIHDLERDARTRLTFDPADDRSPVWSPDDGRLAFSSGRAAEGELWVRPTSGQGAAERLFTAETSILLTDWSSDGHLIFFDYLELDDDSLDVWTFNLQTSEARPLLSGKPEQQGASLSPDGKWLAFTSDESGKSEIYVQTFPEATGRWMVSSDGSTRGAYNAVWRSDGRELFYQRWRSLMAVPVTPGGDFPFGTPQPLFGINNKSGQGASYAVDESGDRILINERPAADPTKSGARLIQNWSGALAEQ